MNKTNWLFACMLLTTINATAQNNVVLKPYNAWDMHLLYSDSAGHTAAKTILYEDTTGYRGSGSWIKRKIFDEHLLTVEKNGFNLYADFIPDFQVGASARATKTPWMNTRAVRVQGNIGRKIYFETEDFENQGRFPGYVDSYINKNRVVPYSQTYRKNSATSPFDYNNAGARLMYIPNKLIRFDLGYGRNFIGDGYRSMLLSDWAFNYPYLKVTGTYKSLQYSVMWSQYVSGFQSSYYYSGYPRKWGQTFFLDWNFSKRGSIGLFESVIWPDQDNNNRKDLSWTMASPIIFVHGSKSPSGTANSTLTGLNAKYRVASKTFAYGQFAVTNFMRNSNWSERFAAQIGIRSNEPLGLKGLNLIAEFNTAKPLTYAAGSRATNYAHFNQPLAHPLGAAFSEGLLIANYQYKRWYVRGQLMLARYDLDSAANVNAGQDIFKPTTEITTSKAATIATSLTWWDIRAGWIINPQTNLRIEAGFTFRNENSNAFSFAGRVFMFGLRGSFRSLMYDF